jgi:hypothetical protein
VAQTNILNTAAPNLPVATNDYERKYQDQFSNALRLYFRQLDNSNDQLIRAANSLSVMNWLNTGSF